MISFPLVRRWLVETFGKHDTTSPDGVRTQRGDWWAGALLVLCAWLVHGNGLTFGFWFDDHNHLELCRQNGFADLANGNRFDWNNRIVHAWWAQQPTGWAYFRPVPVALRTAMLHAFGLNPLPYHIVHLTIYSLSILLFYALLRQFDWRPATALIAGLFFVLHPANVFVTVWLANDGPVLIGLWFVLGVWLMHASTRTGHRRPLILVGMILVYALALLTRENGIMLGPVLVLCDFLSTRAPTTATWRRRWALYGGLALLGLMYLPLRSWCLGEVTMPRNPYFHWPMEPGFLAWLPYKTLNDLVCLPLGLPMLPIVEVPWWQARPVTTALGVLFVIGFAAFFLYPLRRSRVLWGVLGGIVLVQAPTALAFSAPYNYYLATVGIALVLALWSQHFWTTRPRLVLSTLSGMGVLFFVGSWANSWLLHSAARAERLVRADVLATHPEEYPQGTKLFFINMPFFAAESGPAVRLAAERTDLEFYPLTFSPDVFLSTTEMIVEQEDAHTARAVDGKGALFRRIRAAIQLGWFGANRSDLKTGPVTVHPSAGAMPFRVEVVEEDQRGVLALRFVFDRPLDDPHYRFFLGSPWTLAQAIHFQSGKTDGEEAAESDDSRLPMRKRIRTTTTLACKDFERLRRMQITCNIALKWLERWPF